MSQEAMHASAPEQHLCADCTMDKEACPICYKAWWQRRHPNTIQIDAALKGKGASQGADELMCPMTAQVCYDPRAQCKPGYCRRQLVPEPSGEFVRVPREPTEAMLNEMHKVVAHARGYVNGLLPEIYRAMLAACPDEQKG